MKSSFSSIASPFFVAAAAALACASAVAQPASPASPLPVRVVVQYADTQTASAMLQGQGPIVLDRASAQSVTQSLVALHSARASQLTQAAGGQVQFQRLMASGHAVYTAAGDPAATVSRLRATPGVASAELDLPVYPTQTAQAAGNGGYNDALAESQWWHEPGNAVKGGANVWAAHAQGARGQGRVVAVLDTGHTAHPDLPAPVGQYDFVSGGSSAGDGGGRDPDASDPGDFCTSSNPSTPATWHGTSTAGLISAVANNSRDFVGAAPSAQLMHIRVLGRCGGFLSDIADAMSWLGGYAVAGVPAATLRPHIVNMSLGASGLCPAFMQSAVNAARAGGLLLIASAGNKGVGTTSAPANCTGVVSVGAATASGDVTSYTSTGSGISLLAPGGGNCAGGGGGACETQPLLTLANDGLYAVGSPSLVNFTGTSASAPMVSAAAAAVWGVRPDLTADQVRDLLLSTARAVPANSRCVTDASYAAACGSGLLDTGAAVSAALSGTPAAYVAIELTAAPVARGRSGTIQALAAGANDYTYAWQQLSGPALTLRNANTPSLGYTAPSGASGFVVLRLTATSSTLGTATATTQLLIDSPPALASQPARMPLVAGAPLSLDLGASDPEGTVSLTLVSGPAGMAIQSGRLVWPSAAAGDHAAVVLATDSAGQTVSTTLQFSVAAAGSSGSGGGGAADDVSLAALAAICCAALAMKAREKQQEA